VRHASLKMALIGAAIIVLAKEGMAATITVHEPDGESGSRKTAPSQRWDRHRPIQSDEGTFQCHLCCAATRQKSFPSYWSVCFPLHQPAMRQTLHLMEGIYLQERRPMGSFFICMDATGW
jgi:hypothetical protein